MVEIILGLQIVSVVFMFIQVLYIVQQHPSKLQMIILMLGASTIVTLIGYTVEVTAKDLQTAITAVGFSYIGKPFALLASLLFVTTYCGKRPSRYITIPMASISWLYPIIILSEKLRPLYYSYVEFDETRRFSKLVMGKGPLYYMYMVMIIGTFLWSLIAILKEYRSSKDKESRIQCFYIFAMIGSTVLGYLIYLSGLTGGYDTTMAGTALGTIFLSILFFRYRLVDNLTLAKEKALDDATNGVLVLNYQGRVMYMNIFMKQLLETDFTEQSLMDLKQGHHLIQRNGNVYEVQVKLVMNKGRHHGKTVEVNDITVKHNYSEKLQTEVAVRTKEIKDIQRSAITSFASMVEARDNSTGKHIKTMSKYVQIISDSLLEQGDYSKELNRDFIARLVDVSPLHDIGKISIPDSVLSKPGKLTNEEFDLIKTHTTQGKEIIQECLFGLEEEDYVVMAENVAYSHHEKWDGSGYPLGLKGEEIPLSARIVAIADVYDAIRSKRCYKDAMSKEEARKIIKGGSGTHFDPIVVDAFFRKIDEIETV